MYDSHIYDVMQMLVVNDQRFLGHKRVSSVKHYRKMSNQQMADETREVRQMMSDIIYKSLAGWGEEYEQIRQDD